MNINSMMARIVAANDQDEEECKQWICEASNAEIASLWDRIQNDYDDPEMECMSRFAQLGFGLMVVRLMESEKEST